MTRLKIKALLISACVVALLFGGGLLLVNAQQAGGAFLPTFNYLITGLWNFDPSSSSTVAFQSDGTNITHAQLQEYKTAGVTILDGSNPTSVTMSPLGTIHGCALTIHGTVAPGLDPTAVSAVVAAVAGRLDIYAWKPTGAGDTTLIASTNSTRYIDYVCAGVQ